MRTAIGLMGEQGYEGTSTRDIARAAGVSVAALYYHFPSKLDLLREFIIEAHDVVLMRFERAVGDAGDDPRAQLDAAVDTIVGSNIHSTWAQGAAQVAWREFDRLEPKGQRAVVERRDALVNRIEAILKAGVKAGAFTTTETADVANAILRLSMSAVEWFGSSGRTVAEAVELHQRLAAGLANAEPKGGKRRK
jgi:AcrR family transcriptional regulator